VIFRVLSYSDTVLVKKEKKSVIAIQASPYDDSTYYHFCVTIIFTTSLVFFHKRFFITISSMIETTDPGQGKFLINDNTKYFKFHYNSSCRRKQRSTCHKKTSRPRDSTPQIPGFQSIQHPFSQSHPDYHYPHSHPTHHHHHLFLS